MKHLFKGKKKIIIIITCVLLLLIGLVAGRIIYITTATKGEPIAKYSEDKAALVVIDVQNDTVQAPQYKNADDLMKNINSSIEAADKKGMDIIYIRQEYSNPFDLILTGGKYKANNKGSELSDKLLVKSDHIFNKLKSDSFSQKSFEQYLITNKINTLYIVGADASACVYKTSLGGVNRDYQVTILKDCIFSMNEKIRNKMIKEYEKNDINTLTLQEFNK